jgi:hypothetical protein
MSRAIAHVPRRADRIAGCCAILAGLCWFAWAIANSVTHRGLELSPPGSGLVRLGIFLTIGWNLLLIPAALRLFRASSSGHFSLSLVAAGAGILSLVSWSVGALTRNTHALEFAYLALASVWLLIAARLMPPGHRRLAGFTLIVGLFTALDAVFNRFEPMPFAVYVLAAPKLPLSAIWSVCIGVSLWSSSWTPEPETSARSPVPSR